MYTPGINICLSMCRTFRDDVALNTNLILYFNFNWFKTYIITNKSNFSSLAQSEFKLPS